jgi:hypothetical protein
MRGFEGFSDLEGQFQGFLNGDRTAFDSVRECIPFHRLHDKKVGSTGLFQAVNGSYVGMIERCEQLGFPLETRNAIRVLCEFFRHDFDGYISAKDLILCPIDLPHPTLANFPHNDVMRKTLTDFRHEFPLLKKTYMLLSVVKRILGLIIGTGDQYQKRNLRVTIANGFDRASIWNGLT